MTTQLSLYQDALGHIGERMLASITENVEARRVLDQAWPGVLKYCLEHAHWKFAQRTSKISYSPSVEPQFGHQRAFEKPTDMVKLSKLCGDEFFMLPLPAHAVVEENGFFFADIDDIYVSYVSNDTSYGGDYSLWPETFSLYVSLYLASRIYRRLKPNMDTTDLLMNLKVAKEDAQAKDAVQGPTQFLPRGSWVSARRDGSYQGWDRGSRSSFYG